MKYDSSMTQYREDILLTVKQVFGRDINIINNYIPGYAVMPSLKDYLKNNYVNCGGTISDGLQCLCSQTKGLVISYTSPINNSGDKTLTLSWSQTAKFIMDNWEDVFVKSEPEEAADAKPTYKDVFLEHYPDFDTGKFEKFAKEACVEYYFEASPSCDHECKSHWNSECLSKWSDEIEDCDLEIIKKYLVTNVGKKAPEPDKTYKDILLEHYPNFDMSRFGDFIVNFCIDNFFDIGGFQCSYGVTSPANDDDFMECRKHWENKCLHEWRKENDKINLNDIEEYLIPEADETPAQEIVPANAEKYVFACDGCKYDKQGCCNYPETQNDYCVNGDKKICSDPPAQNDTAATVFDYSELDGDTADKLREVSDRVISIKAKYILETAQQVKIAHDLLANHYNGLWGIWCKSVGFTRQTGDNLLKVVKLFDNISEEERKNLTKLTDGNMNLLYAASKPSAPPELVEAVKSGDITSHKDFVAMKKQLEEANGRAEEAEMLSRTYKQNYDQMNKNFQEACEDNTELEKRIKELESRPRDVVIQPDEKVLEENAELKKQIDDMQNELMFANCTPAVDIKEFYETLHGAALSAIRDCEGFAKGHPECRARFKMFAEVIDDCIKEMEE